MRCPKIIFLLIALLPCCPLWAQAPKHQWGLQSSTGISGLVFHYKDEYFEKFIQNGAALRFSGGISGLYLYKVNPLLFLQAGLGYELSGYRVKPFNLYQSIENMPEQVYIGKASGRFNYHYLMLAFSGKVKPFGVEKMPYLRGGLAGQVNLKQSVTNVVKYENGTVLRTVEPLASNGRIATPFNLRLEFGLGLDFKAFGRSGFFIEPTYGFSILPVYREYQGGYYQYIAGINLGFLW